MLMRVLLVLGLLWDVRSAAAETCRNPQTQSMMNSCAADQLLASEKRMAAVLAKVMARLHDQAETRALLSQSQSTWDQFRIAHCRFTTVDTVGGSINPLLYANCLEGLTIDRTRQLSRYVRCRNGDLDCPGPVQQ